MSFFYTLSRDRTLQHLFPCAFCPGYTDSGIKALYRTEWASLSDLPQIHKKLHFNIPIFLFCCHGGGTKMISSSLGCPYYFFFLISLAQMPSKQVWVGKHVNWRLWIGVSVTGCLFLHVSPAISRVSSRDLSVKGKADGPNLRTCAEDPAIPFRSNL